MASSVFMIETGPVRMVRQAPAALASAARRNVKSRDTALVASHAPSKSGRAGEISMDRFERYLAEFRRPIYTYVLRLVRDPHLSEDITQETFVRLYKEIDNIRDETASAWMYRVARNLVTDHSRKKKPVLFNVLRGRRATETSEGRESVDFAGSDASPHDQTWESDLQKILHDALERMSPKYRDPLVLCDLEKLTYEQAAEVLGCSVKTVSARLHRAREFLAGCLKKHVRTDT